MIGMETCSRIFTEQEVKMSYFVVGNVRGQMPHETERFPGWQTRQTGVWKAHCMLPKKAPCQPTEIGSWTLLRKGVNMEVEEQRKEVGEAPGGLILERWTPDVGGQKMPHFPPAAPAAGTSPAPTCPPRGTGSPPGERPSIFPSHLPHQVPGGLRLTSWTHLPLLLTQTLLYLLPAAWNS